MLSILKCILMPLPVVYPHRIARSGLFTKILLSLNASCCVGFPPFFYSLCFVCWSLLICLIFLSLCSDTRGVSLSRLTFFFMNYFPCFILFSSPLETRWVTHLISHLLCEEHHNPLNKWETFDIYDCRRKRVCDSTDGSVIEHPQWPMQERIYHCAKNKGFRSEIGIRFQCSWRHGGAKMLPQTPWRVRYFCKR